MLKNDLPLYPYRIQIKQTLTKNDMAKGVEICRWFERKIEEMPDFLENVWFCHEAHFSLSGYVNCQKSVLWGAQVPDEVVQRPLYSAKCIAWVPIWKYGINGPFWCENDDRETVMINKKLYNVVLNKFWKTLWHPSWRAGRVARVPTIGATPHTVNITMEWLDRCFAGRLIRRRCVPEWSVLSRDLNPPDFYLWGFLKDCVYQNNTQTIAELKEAITQQIRGTAREVCVEVIVNFA